MQRRVEGPDQHSIFQVQQQASEDRTSADSLDPPRHAQPESAAALSPPHQCKQEPAPHGQQEQVQQPLANRPREASPLWYQQQQALSNVVEIDDVEVNPIDDPFYDPQNPTSSTDKSRLSAQAVLSDDNSTSSVPQPRSNAVAIDEVDFEGFTAPLLEEAGRH